MITTKFAYLVEYISPTGEREGHFDTGIVSIYGRDIICLQDCTYVAGMEGEKNLTSIRRSTYGKEYLREGVLSGTKCRKGGREL